MAKKLPHPSLDIVDSHGTELAGKNIVLCVAAVSYTHLRAHET